MVKNSTGGNKAKGFARKNIVKSNAALRVAREEGEIYAQAEKILGGSIASAIDINGNPLRVHIRGKFRGRGKRDNFIGPNTWLLVGLHEWSSSKEKPGEPRDCDVLEVYSDTDKNRLRSTVTSVDWNRFINNDMKTLGGSDHDNDDSGIIFADETTQEYEELFAAQSSTVESTNIIVEGETINVDDI